MTNWVNWSLNHLDRLFIGRLLGTWSLGLYNVAYNLASVPGQVVLGALQPAFVAAGAQMQADRNRLRQAYTQMLATLLVLGLPAGAALALLAPDLMALLYGARWLEAGPVLACLLATLPLLAIWGISTPVLWNTGRAHHEWRLQLPLIALGALLLWRAAGGGLLWAAAAAAALLLLRAVVLVAAALHALELPAAAVLRHLGRAAAMCGLTSATLLLLQSLATTAPMRLLISTLVPAAILGLLIKLRPRWLARAIGQDAWSMLLRFAPGLRGPAPGPVMPTRRNEEALP